MSSRGLRTPAGTLHFKSKHPDAPAGIFPEVRPEDKLMMDGVRTALGDPGYRFNVFLLNKDTDWVYTELRVLNYAAGRISESREERALLRKVDGVWTVQQMGSMEGTSQTDFIAGLKQRYPDIPAGVLP